jgi:uncharacterized protein
MKKLLLFFTILLLTTSAFSQSVVALMNRSGDFFDTLSAGKFEDATTFFDPTLQAQVKPEHLKSLWEKLDTQIGKYESAEIVQSKSEGEFFVVVVEGKFAKDSQRFVLAFNKGEKMVGFYLQQKAPSSAYALPAYADTANIKQQEVKIKGAKNDLVGMLTMPKTGSNFPVVILVEH